MGGIWIPPTSCRGALRYSRLRFCPVRRACALPGWTTIIGRRTLPGPAAISASPVKHSISGRSAMILGIWSPWRNEAGGRTGLANGRCLVSRSSAFSRSGEDTSDTARRNSLSCTERHTENRCLHGKCSGSLKSTACTIIRGR